MTRRRLNKKTSEHLAVYYPQLSIAKYAYIRHYESKPHGFINNNQNMKPLKIKFAPDCKYCNDDGEIDVDYQYEDTMRSYVQKCICQLVSPSEVSINVLSRVAELELMRIEILMMTMAPSLEMAWAGRHIISTTLPSPRMAF